MNIQICTIVKVLLHISYFPNAKVSTIEENLFYRFPPLDRRSRLLLLLLLLLLARVVMIRLGLTSMRVRVVLSQHGPVVIVVVPLRICKRCGGSLRLIRLVIIGVMMLLGVD